MVAAVKEIKASEGLIRAVFAEKAKRDRARVTSHPSEFRKAVLIDCDGRSRTVDTALDPWQRQDYEALDPAWQRLAGKRTEPDSDEIKQRAYLERPRGHSKTTDLAVAALYALFASDRKIIGVGVAAAKKQAKLLRDACDAILRLNSWLAAEIEINNFEVKNTRTGSEFKIIASDAETGMGETPDFVIVDELTHWKKEDLWDTVFTSVAKRSRCVLVVIANAGFDQGHGWRWFARERCRTDRDWYFNRLDGPSASWQSKKALEEQRRLLRPAAYKRLWLNIWTSGSSDGLAPEDVEAAITLIGPHSGPHAPPYHFVIGALDLGIHRDHAAFVAFGLDCIAKRAAMLYAQRWNPADFPGHKISLMQVRDEVYSNCRRLGVRGVAFDPWQAELMGEELAALGVPMFPYEFSPKHCDDMARELKAFFVDRKIDLYREESLIKDLYRLQFKDKGMASKLVAPRDENGHCDMGTAVAIVLPWVAGTLRDFSPEADQ